MNIILIGPRGSGKSTIGPRLARQMARPFVELDELALRHTGLNSVHEVWTTQGEAAWRHAEADALLGALAKQSQVIALGGGAPMIQVVETALLNASGKGEAFIVYLRCPVAHLRHRLQADPGDRPSLTGAGVVEEVATVLAAREPTYLRLAHFVCDTDVNQPAAAVKTIIDAMRTRPATR